MPRGRAILFLVVAAGFAGCTQEKQPTEFVARVGTSYLLQNDLDRALASLPAAQDSAEARQQIVEQWLTNELLYQEAQRRNLRDDDEVKRLLKEGERSVLVNALLTRIYDENPLVPTPAELQAYYEQNKEQLRLRETFVRVRFLEATSSERAEEARRVLQRTTPAEADSIWSLTIQRLSRSPDIDAAVSSSYFPEGRLFADRPELRRELGGLLDDQVAPVVEADSGYYVVQLVERVPPRTIPKPEWVEEELVRRLVIGGRKQLYSRQVQRLRNEALAREDLVVK